MLQIMSSATSNPTISSPVIQMDFIKKQDGKITVSEFTPRPGITFSACNGVVILSRLYRENSGDVFIADLVTKRLQKLPTPIHAPDSLFDHVFGMTYKVSTEEYKVLHYFICSSNNRLLGCEVITVGSSNNWKLVKLEHTALDLCRQSRKIVFVKDVAHWMVSEVNIYFVVSFDMVKERFWETKLPRCSPEAVELLDVGGVLSLVNPINDCRTCFDVWFLKDFGQEWVKQKKINLDRVNRSVSAVASDENGGVIIFAHRDQPVFYYAYDVQFNGTAYLGVESECKLPHIGGLVFKTLRIPGKKWEKAVVVVNRKKRTLKSIILRMFH